MEPEETNQRMVEAGWGGGVVTCSSLARSMARGRGGISEGRKGGWVEVKMYGLTYERMK